MPNPPDWPFADPPNVACFTTWRVLDGIEPIVYVSHDAEDGAWQFLPESGAIEELAAIVGLAEMCSTDPTLLQLACLPLGWRAERSEQGAPWMWLPHDMPLEIIGMDAGVPCGEPDRLTEEAMCAVLRATRAFVSRDEEEMRRLTRAEIDYQALYHWADQYPDSIAMPSGDFSRSVIAICVTAAGQPIWSVCVDLGDGKGGRSDLTLSGDLYRFGTQFVFVYTDCRVL